MLNFAESGHLTFRATSASERGALKSRGQGVESIHPNGSDDTIELILRTVIPVNQLSVYGAVADLCQELARDSRGAVKPAANVNLESMVIPTEFLTANLVSQIDAAVQGNLLREYEQKFAELLEQEKLTKLCSNAGSSKNIDKGQFLITHDDDALTDMNGSCREYTLLRSEESSHVGGWIRGNTKIGPVLDMKVCYHQGRCSVEIMIESLFHDRTVSWVRIVNGINTYVTETSEEIQPRPTPTLSLVSMLCRERTWTHVEPGNFSQGCFEVSNFMIRLPRHCDTFHPKDDGALRFDDLAALFLSRFAGTSHWLIEA